VANLGSCIDFKCIFAAGLIRVFFCLIVLSAGEAQVWFIRNLSISGRGPFEESSDEVLTVCGIGEISAKALNERAVALPIDIESQGIG